MTPKLIRRRRSAGISLLEVIVGIFLLLAGTLMFATLVTAAVKSGRMVGNHQQAVSIVQHKIDQLRAVGYGRLTHEELHDAGIVDSIPDALPFKFNSVDELDRYFPNAIGSVTVEDFSTNVRKVTVNLTWTGSAYRQGNGEMSVITYIARG
jgi:hypothetical protein